MSKAWWRQESLSVTEEHLLMVLREAHHLSSFRENISSLSVAYAAQGSLSIGSAIAAGIMTLGGRHAPIEETCEFLMQANPHRSVEPMIRAGQKIPGWGGTFQKDAPDPLWAQLDLALREFRPQLAADIDRVTEELSRFVKIFPNPSAYTASVAIALGMPCKLAVYLFISARLDAWASIALSNVESVERK